MNLSVHILLGFTFIPLFPAAADKVTYDEHVFPIFQQICLNCHNPDKTKGGLDLSTFAGAMKGGSGGKIVEPGDTGSKLMTCVMQTGELKMPPEGDKLSNDHINQLKAWIEGGLLENKSSSARKPTKPKFDTALKSDPATKPDGPPPVPAHVLLEPEIVTLRSSAIHAMVASPWAPLIALTGQHQVLLFDTLSLELTGVLPFPEGDPVSLAFTPNARYLIVGGGIPGKSGLTVTFDVTTGKRVLTAAREFDTILAADLSPDLGRVATGSASRLVKLWKAEDGSQLSSIKKHTDWLTALDFSPDGILLATGDRNGGVWVWEATSGSEFHTLRGHQAGITAAAFRPDSNLLATASEDGTVRFWEMDNGGEIKKIDAHTGGVLAFSWARDGSFATAGRDKSVKLWKSDFNQTREIKDLPDIPTAVTLDSDGKRVFIADYSGVVFVHDVEKGDRIGQFDANPPSIASRIASLQQGIAAHQESHKIVLAARTEAATKLDEARKRVADTETQLTQAKEAVPAAQKSLDETRANQQQARLEREQHQAKIQQAREQSRQLQEQVDPRQKSLSELAQKLAVAKQELDQSQTLLQAEEQAPDSPEKAAKVAAARLVFEQRQAPHTDIAAQHQRGQAELDPLVAKLDESRQTIGTLEEQLNPILEKEKTFPPLIDAANKSLDAARNRVPEAEKQLAEVLTQRPPTEETLKKSDAALAESDKRLAQLKQQLARWTAADVNTRLIKTTAAAEALAQETESLAADLADLNHKIEVLNTEIATRRGELNAAATKLNQKPDEATATELRTVLKSHDTTLAAQVQKQAAFQNDFLKLRHELDQQLPKAAQLKTEAATLKEQYHTLVSQPTP